MMNKRVEMNENMLDQVNGGTFTLNTLDTKYYEAMGVKVTANWIYKDEFTLPNGTKTDMAGADKYCQENFEMIFTGQGDFIQNKTTREVVYCDGKFKRWIHY